MNLNFKATGQRLVPFTEAGQQIRLFPRGRHPFIRITNTSSNPNAVVTLFFGENAYADPEAPLVVQDYAGIVLYPKDTIQFDKISSCGCAIWAKLVAGVDPAVTADGRTYTHQLSVADAFDII